jgi:uncharacterized protein
MAGSLVAGAYEKTQDRESAYEKLKARTVEAQATAAAGKSGTADADRGVMGGLSDVIFGSTGPRGGRREGLAEAMAKSAIRTMGSTVGREIIRGVLGSIMGGAKRR